MPILQMSTHSAGIRKSLVLAKTGIDAKSDVPNFGSGQLPYARMCDTAPRDCNRSQTRLRRRFGRRLIGGDGNAVPGSTKKGVHAHARQQGRIAIQIERHV